MIPPAKRGGRKRSVEAREIVNGLMYVLSTGCQWRYVPKDLPPKSTLFGYFGLWNWDVTLDRIHPALYVKCREAMGREASPAACVIDSQSVKSAEPFGKLRRRARIDPDGYDAGNPSTGSGDQGQEAPILADTLGLLPHAVVHPADIQDRDGGVLVLSTLSGLYPFLQSSLLMADIRARSFKRLQPKSCRICKSKSSNAPIRQKGRLYCGVLDGDHLAVLTIRGSVITVETIK